MVSGDISAQSGADAKAPPAKRQRVSEGKADLLDKEAFFERARAARLRTNPDAPLISAMYSSLVDGIVVDPQLMVVPLDDHAFLRGHAIFDTASLVGGRIYRLKTHLRRFFDGAKEARLQLPFGPTEGENRARITEIICKLCVASGRRDGAIRYFLSAGPGNFGFTTAGCEPAFYCVIYGSACANPTLKPHDECTVRSDSVPMKPPLLARVKSNNYMLNCLTAMCARDRGGSFGILVREDDTIAECCVLNVMCVTKDRVMLTPEFGDILSGTTVRRAMELARRHLVGEGKLLREVRQEVVPLAAARAAIEICCFGGDKGVYPVRRLDGEVVGDGKTFPVSEALHRLLIEDMQHGSEEHIVVDYS